MKPYVLALCLFAVTAPLRAQAPNIDSLRIQLANEKDIPSLRKREFELNRHAALHPEALVERGMVLMRLHQLTKDDEDARQAHNMFERALKKLPQDPQVYYGMGLSRMGGYGVRIPSPLGILNKVTVAQSVAEIIKKDPASLAKDDFKRALMLEPSLVGPAIELAQLSIDTHDKENMEQAAQALRRLVAQKLGGAEAATTLSEVESALGNVQAASVAAETATDISAGSADPNAIASAALARAIALLRQNGKEEAGAKAYFDGVDQLTEKSAAAYFSGIAPIVSRREEEDWAGSSLQGKQAYLKRFWQLRAAGAGVTVGERLAEHYRRLARAQEKFRHESGRGAQPTGSLVTEANIRRDLPFDDRGFIYIRHGEPKTIVRTSDAQLRPNETWVYEQNGKYELYNFVVYRNSTDYRLTDDVLSAVDANAAGIPTEAAAKLLRDRQLYEPRYAPLALRFEKLTNRGATNAAGIDPNSPDYLASDVAHDISGAQTRIAADQRAAAIVALKTDSDAPDFKADMPFYYDLYAFKGVSGLTDVTAAAAVPGTSLFSQRHGGQYIYSLQASLIFIDTATNEITRRDTTYNYWSTRVLGPNEYLRVTVNMSVPFAKAGVHRIVLRDLVDPGVGQLYGGPSELHNFSGASLMMSDIVLAESDNGVWKRGLAQLSLVPPRQFEQKKPLKIFYEIYNLPNETPYRTEISMIPVQGAAGFGRLRKLFGGSDGGIHLQFDGVAQANADGIVQELRQVTTEVKPGKYRIEVRVTNLKDQQVVRNETMFIVSKGS